MIENKNKTTEISEVLIDNENLQYNKLKDLDNFECEFKADNTLEK